MTARNLYKGILFLEPRRRLLAIYCAVLLSLVFLFFLSGTSTSLRFVLTKWKGWNVRIPTQQNTEVNNPNLLRAQKKNAIASNLQNDHYVEYALVLAYTIQKYNPIFSDGSTDLILLVPHNNDLNEHSISRLKEVGWQIRYEHDIDVPGTENLLEGFRRNYIKLRIWNWTEYRKVALLDADIMVLGDISLLLSDGYDVGAVPDTWPDAMPGLNFNAGVLSLTPSTETYAGLLNYTFSNPVTDFAEQDVLNNFFPSPKPGPFYPSAHTRVVLPMKYNLNVEAQRSHPDQWDDIWPDARIVHFTVAKPLRDAWRCMPDPECQFQQSFKRYIDLQEEMRATLGWEKYWDSSSWR